MQLLTMHILLQAAMSYDKQRIHNQAAPKHTLSINKSLSYAQYRLCHCASGLRFQDAVTTIPAVLCLQVCEPV